MTPWQDDQLDILRRIADRGIMHASIAALSTPPVPLASGWSAQVDLWQHMLDELKRLRQDLQS